MPATINGIGTHYYGKRNPRHYAGTCDSCGNHGALIDYETSHFIVVLFIPVIPLGKKQIIGECSSCQRHRVMPLHQWQQVAEEAIDGAMGELAESPNDLDKAFALLSSLTVFNRRDDAMDLAASMRSTHQDDLDAQVAIGSWFEQQGLTVEGDACFNRAVEINPKHPACLRIQAVELMAIGKPREAAEQLEALRHPSDHYDPGLFLRLANSFQDHGEHDSALAEYGSLIEQLPDFGKDKQIRKAVQRSEKALGRSESILPKKGLFG